jgi:hypothetical protein
MGKLARSAFARGIIGQSRVLEMVVNKLIIHNEIVMGLGEEQGGTSNSLTQVQSKFHKILDRIYEKADS